MICNEKALKLKWSDFQIRFVRNPAKFIASPYSVQNRTKDNYQWVLAEKFLIILM